MYYEPNARITIGDVVFNNVNKVIITESVKEMGDVAIITLPRNYKKLAGKSVLDYLASGQKATIELGTGGKYYEEFTGFLGQIESDAPMILHIDDNFYPLKLNSFKNSWEKVTLLEVLNYIAKDYTINAPDVNLGAFEINNVSSYKVLRALQEQYGFFTYIKGSTLNCQFAFDVRGTGDKFTYKFGNNIKKNNLKYHRAEDVKIKIKAIANQRTGKKITYETGSTDPQASLRTLNFGNISESELKEIAEKTYNKLSYDGYSGTIKGYAMPRTHAGDTLSIIDEDQADREGDYLIEKTIIRYGLTIGFERINTLSFKV
ncbi:MAG: hypothetical protein IMY72_11735 [Bacteroidetes bacterium]|nr:hypothetical protein [Bacteroidota bacterium]